MPGHSVFHEVTSWAALNISSFKLIFNSQPCRNKLLLCKFRQYRNTDKARVSLNYPHAAFLVSPAPSAEVSTLPGFGFSQIFLCVCQSPDKHLQKQKTFLSALFLQKFKNSECNFKGNMKLAFFF